MSLVLICNVSHKVRHKGFICIFVIVEAYKTVTWLIYDCLIFYYALFYSFNCHIHELFWLIGFFVTFLDINNPAFCKTNSSEKLWIPDKKYLMQPWWWWWVEADVKSFLSQTQLLC